MVEPGKCCEACGQRKPYPKKPDSPDSKVVSYRVPVSEKESHLEILEAVASSMGTLDRPYWKFNTIMWSLASALKDPETDGIAVRNGWE